MKVVHPGESDQAVGWKPVSADQELARRNIHNDARLTPQGRLLLVQRVSDHGWTVRSAAEAAGLSQRQTYRWLKRYRAGGAAARADRSSAPQRCPHEVPAEPVAEIERVRRQRLSGPAIARQLGMPASTVGGILRRPRPGQAGGAGDPAAGGAVPAGPAGRAAPHRRQEARAHRGRRAAVGHRITGDRRDTSPGAGWEYVHVGIDDASRLAYGEVLPNERKDHAVPFLERAVGWFARQGVSIERVMTDNGSAYRRRQWREACGALALRHLRTRPYTPRTNGKAERFIQTGLRESAYARPYASSAERTAALLPWLEHYNHARPHTALAQQPPASRISLPGFLGSTGTVPPSRPELSPDRSGGMAPGAPQATGASRRAASLRRPAGPVTLQQEGPHV